MTIETEDGTVEEDGCIRPDTSAEALAEDLERAARILGRAAAPQLGPLAPHLNPEENRDRIRKLLLVRRQQRQVLDPEIG